MVWEISLLYFFNSVLGTQLQAGQEPRRPAVLGRLLEGIGDP